MLFFQVIYFSRFWRSIMKKILRVITLTSTLMICGINANAQNNESSIKYMKEKLNGTNVKQHMKKIVSDNIAQNETQENVQETKEDYIKKGITTVVDDWQEVKFSLMDACKKSGYEVKTIIDRQNKIICARKTKVSGRELELNIRFEGKKVMRGFYIDTEQWYEGESKDGSPKVYTINQNINQPNVDEIWNKVTNK